MNIAIIGSGGREHSICYKLSKSKKINKIYCIPGNAGTKKLATNIKLNINNVKLKRERAGSLYLTLQETLMI